MGELLDFWFQTWILQLLDVNEKTIRWVYWSWWWWWTCLPFRLGAPPFLSGWTCHVSCMLPTIIAVCLAATFMISKSMIMVVIQPIHQSHQFIQWISGENWKSTEEYISWRFACVLHKKERWRECFVGEAIVSIINDAEPGVCYKVDARRTSSS